MKSVQTAFVHGFVSLLAIHCTNPRESDGYRRFGRDLIRKAVSDMAFAVQTAFVHRMLPSVGKHSITPMWSPYENEGIALPSLSLLF